MENVHIEFDSIYLSFQESRFVTCVVSAKAQMSISLLLSERVGPPAYTRHHFVPFILISLFLEVGNFSEVVEWTIVAQFRKWNPKVLLVFIKPILSFVNAGVLFV